MKTRSSFPQRKCRSKMSKGCFPLLLAIWCYIVLIIAAVIHTFSFRSSASVFKDGCVELQCLRKNFGNIRAVGSVPHLSKCCASCSFRVPVRAVEAELRIFLCRGISSSLRSVSACLSALACTTLAAACPLLARWWKLVDFPITLQTLALLLSGGGTKKMLRSFGHGFLVHHAEMLYMPSLSYRTGSLPPIGTSGT